MNSKWFVYRYKMGVKRYEMAMHRYDLGVGIVKWGN